MNNEKLYCTGKDEAGCGSESFEIFKENNKIFVKCIRCKDKMEFTLKNEI